jgi:hypothetical protein
MGDVPWKTLIGGTSCIRGYPVTPLVSSGYEGEDEDTRFYDIGYLFELGWGCIKEVNG